MRDLHC